MLLSHFKRLCVTSATLIAASPLATVVSRSTSLPAVLQQGVPSCAQSCLQASLAEKFPVACSGQEGVQCLCSRYSNNGESLGEVALGCVYSSCSMAEKAAPSAYNVCLGQRDAVIPTKTALTIVATSAPRTSSTSSSSTRSVATPTITITLQTRTTSTQSVVVDSISDIPSATSSPLATFTAVPVTAEEPRRLTPAQIAGLSVAGVAAFVIAVGLMALSVCLRRRKERRNVFDSDEKGLSRKSKKYPPRVSQYVAVGSIPEPPKRFPTAPLPVARKGSKKITGITPRGPETLYANRPVQRNGVGTSNNSSDTSISLSQIGVAISAELDGNSAPPRTTAKVFSQRPQSQSHLNIPYRPFSTMTQETVFEEDETTARRRSSVLLPTPPVPIPPIRSLQPSKRAATFDTATGFPIPPQNKSRQATRRSELFLDIPVRHERPQPRRIIATQMPSTGSPRQLPPNQTSRLAPPVRLGSSSSPQATPGSSNLGDVDDYYFSSHKDTTPRASPAYLPHARDSHKPVVQVRPKRSGSTVSRNPSRASTSTNIRDSGSSQTSFETADPSDPTPEDEDSDKQLSSDDSKLSPVAESPISNLRYPKVPRASNQLVPRSPVTSQRSDNSLRSPRNQLRSPPSTSHLLQNRRKDLAPLLLETRLPLKLTAPKDIALVPQPQPLKDPFTSPPRMRAHVRSNSTESWSMTPRSKIERKSRTQSGMWSQSPAMYDEPATIAPLKVRKGSGSEGMSLKARRKRDEMQEINVGRDVDHDAEMDGLKSPVWVPRLTPSRKGEDLFISVGWGGR